MKRFLTLLVLCSISTFGLAQVTLFDEDFDDEPNSNNINGGLITGSDNGYTWTASGRSSCDGTGYFGVQNGRFRVNDVEGFTCDPSCGGFDGGSADNFWGVGGIDISGLCEVRVDVSISASGDFEGSGCGYDQITVAYTVDGDQEFLEIVEGNNLERGFSFLETGLSGDVLDISITLGNQANNENFYINRVSVIGTEGPEADAGTDQTICEGESTTLSASGGDIYNWSNGQDGASISVSPTSTTTYTVTVTENGCEATDEVTVNVNPAPTADAGSNQTICEGESTTLSASGGDSYSWSNGQNGASISVSPNSTTTYTVIVTDDGCEDTDQVTVTVNPAPTADAGSTQTICEGESTTLSASGGDSYSWSNGQNGASISVSPASTSTYTVTVTENGCEDVDEVTVEVNSAPTANASGDGSICEGELATLTASGGNLYQWSDGQVGATITVGPANSTTYTVTVTDENGCEDTDEVSVDVTPTPQADAGIDQTICIGESATLTASGGFFYDWADESGNPILGDATITVTPATTTTYAVTVSENGCEDVDEVTVLVNELPSLTLITADCNSDFTGYNAEVTISSGNTLSSSAGTVTNNGNGNFFITDIPNDNDVTLTVTDPNTGCSDELVVTAPDCSCPPLNAPTTSDDVVICENEEIPTFFATVGTDETANWYDAPTGGTLLAADTTAFQPSASGTFYVEAQSTTANACTSIDRTPVSLTINPIPTINTLSPVCAEDLETFSVELSISDNASLSANVGTIIDNGNGNFSITEVPKATDIEVVATADGCVASQIIFAPACACPAINAPASDGDIVICAGDSIPELSVSVGANEVVNWYDAPTDGNLILENSTTFQPENSGTFYAEAVNSINDCASDSRTPINLTINERPTIIAGTANCSPDLTTYSIEITVAPDIDLSATAGMVIDNGNGTFTISEIPEGTDINVEATNPQTSCSTVIEVTAPECNCPAIKAPSNAGDKEVCAGEPLPALEVTINAGETANWYETATSTTILATGTTFTPTAPGTYFVEAKDSLTGCVSSSRTPATLVVNETPSLSATVTPVECELLGSIEVSAEGTDPLLFSIDEAMFDSTRTFTGLSTGFYNLKVEDANGCMDSILVEVSATDQADTTQLNQTSCDPQMVGTETLTFQNEAGCDSIVIITTTLQENDETFLTATTCNSEQAGVDTTILQNQLGCDSLVITTTTFVEPTITNLTATTCEPDAAGVDTLVLQGQAGCDSLVITTTTLLSSDTTRLTQNTCDPSEVGMFMEVLQNQNGCDSTIITEVILVETDVTELTATTCDPDLAGMDTLILQNQFGCDSLVITTTTFIEQDITRLMTTSCDPNATGVDTTFLQNQFGCDSLVITTTTFSDTDITEFAVTTCDEQSVGIDTAFFQNRLGCDSLVITTTTLQAPDTTLIEATTCDPDEAGQETLMLQNEEGCDSLVIITTNFIKPDALFLQATTCDPAQVGSDTLFLENRFGCDSLVITETSLLPSDETIINETSCNPQDTGRFEMVLTNQFGCDSVIIRTVSLASLAECTVQFETAVTNLDCADDTNGSITIVPTNGTAPLTYEWSSSNDLTGNGTIDMLGDTLLLNDLPEGQYTVDITSADGFTVSETFDVLAPEPLISTVETSDFMGFGTRCFDSNDGTAEVTVEGGTAPYSYLWNIAVADSAITNLSAGMYIATVTDAKGCTVIDTALIAQPQEIVSTVSTIAPPCFAPMMGGIRLDSVAGGVEPLEYSLDGELFQPLGDLPIEITAEPGSYTVLVQDINDCLVETEIIVPQAEELELEVSANRTIVFGDTAQLFVDANLELESISWSPTEGLSCTDCPNPIAAPTENTTYQVAVTSVEGCTAEMSLNVTVERTSQVYIATGFSPNGDNNNDRFFIQSDAGVQEVQYLRIYNRWGNMVFGIENPFPTNDPSFGWDGIFDGQEAPNGVYAYQLSVLFKDGTTQDFVGDFTLTR